MNKKICVLYVLLTVFAIADAGSCEGLSRLDKLACQKSVHKQNVEGRRSGKTINTSASVGTRRSEKSESRGSKSASRKVSSQSKVKLPHNRKMSSSSSTSAKVVKKDTKQNAKMTGLTVSNQQGRLNSEQGIAVSHSELLASEAAVDASETAKIPVVNSNMLPSQLSYGNDTGVGDDALYRIY